MTGLNGELPVTVPPPVDQDFFSLVDDRLRRCNERLTEKLLAWGELLDASGWSVALKWAGGGFWLSDGARRDLLKLGKVPSDWSDLLAILKEISPGSVLLKGEGVIVWSGYPLTKDASILAANLTRREAEVLSWLREGKTNPEIAIILGTSTRTVEKHLANLYRKIGIKNRAAVILKYPKP